MNTAAISTAIGEVLTGSLGSTRTVPAGTFSEGVHDGSSEAQMNQRALAGPRFFVRLEDPSRLPAVGPSTSNRVVLEMGVKVVLTYLAPQEIRATGRRAIEATAIDNGETVRRALEWPGNLTQTAAGAATGLVSGCIVFQSSRSGRVNWARRVYQRELTFLARVLDAQ